MNVHDLTILQSKIFTVKSKLNTEPTNEVLQKRLKRYQKKLLGKKSSSRRPSNVVNQATNFMLCKSWNRLNKEFKADRLYMFSLEQELNDTQQTALYNLLKEDLEKRILTKKKEVNYDQDKGVITSITQLDSYLSQLS